MSRGGREWGGGRFQDIQCNSDDVSATMPRAGGRRSKTTRPELAADPYAWQARTARGHFSISGRRASMGVLVCPSLPPSSATQGNIKPRWERWQPSATAAVRLHSQALFRQRSRTALPATASRQPVPPALQRPLRCRAKKAGNHYNRPLGLPPSGGVPTSMVTVAPFW